MKLPRSGLGALVCLAAVVPASAQDTDRPNVTVQFPPPGAVVAEAQPVLRGTATGNGEVSAVRVTVSGGGSVLVSSALAHLEPGSDGWSLSLAPDGLDLRLQDDAAYVLRVEAEDVEGRIGVATRFFETNTEVVDVIIQSPRDGSVLAEPLSWVSGTAEPGSELVLDVGGTTHGPVVAGVDGTFAIALNQALDDGEYTLEITATAGPWTRAAAVDVEVAATRVLTLEQPVDGAVVDEGVVAFRGVADPGARVSVLVAGQVVAGGAADEDGLWSLVTELEAGELTVQILAGIGVGEVASLELSLTVRGPEPDAGTPQDPQSRPEPVDAGTDTDSEVPGDAGADADRGAAPGDARDAGPEASIAHADAEAVRSFVPTGGAGCEASGIAGPSAGGWVLWLLVLVWGCRGRETRSGVALLVCWVVGPGACAASAQDGFALDRYRPSEVLEDGVAISRPDDFGHQRYGLQLLVDYGHDPLVLEEQSANGRGEGAAVVANQLTAHVGFHYGLLHRLVLYAGLPVTLLQQGDDVDGLGVANADGPGLGDAWMGGRVRLWGERADPFAAALQATLTVPLAQAIDPSQAYSGATSVTGSGELLMEGRVRVLRITTNLGVRLGKPAEAESAPQGQQLTFGLGFTLDVGECLAVLLETYGSTYTGDLFGREETPVELVGGARYFAPSGWVGGLSVGPGLGRGVGAPDVRVVATFGYIRPDTSVEPAPQARPAAPPVDPAPSGLEHGRDACPGEMEDLDGHEDADGCPDFDNDGDGVDDVRDRCPNDAEDVDGFDDADGCPDPDNDHDGVFDADDPCPNTPRAPEANLCPRSVQVEKGFLRLERPLQFAENPPGVAIQPGSVHLLVELRDVLAANPPIGKIRIEVHTDDRGEDKLELSRRRALAVKQWLVSHGIDARRLGASGCGDRHPIAFNDTAQGRAANRRVELHVVGADTSGFGQSASCSSTE